MASITCLPAEILQQIINQVITSRPYMGAVCASVSPQWQMHCEMVTFSSLRFDQDRIESSVEIMTPARQSYVRKIHMDIKLPEYDTNESIRSNYRETEDDVRQNDHVFTDAMRLLFQTLAAWEVSAREGGESRRGVSLSIDVSSPSDSLYAMDNIYLPEHDWTRRIARQLKDRWQASYLQLQSSAHGDFPAVHIISSFSCPYGRPHRKISARACCEIAAHLPNVHTLDWVLDDGERHNVKRRIELREEFATALALIPQSVHHFKISYGNGQPDSPMWNPPRLNNSQGSIPDPLSVALRTLAQRLVTLDLDGPIVVDPEIFWPTSSSSSSSISNGDMTLHFPKLERLRIYAAMVTAQGSWLFNHNVAMDDDAIRREGHYYPGYDPMNQFSWLVIPKLANDYFTAAAHNAANTPRLNSLQLTLSSPQPITLFYNAPGTLSGSREALKIESTYPFNLPDEAYVAWQETMETHFKGVARRRWISCRAGTL